MAVSKRLRFEILRRDNHACRYCGATAPDVALTVDHVVPTTLGGGDEPANLVTACAPCNSGKSATTPDATIVDDVAADALRWARAIERAAEMQERERIAEDSYVYGFVEVWESYGGPGDAMPLPADFAQSIQTFRRAGLTGMEVERAIRSAMAARHVPHGRVWRYFCGICWRVIEQRREIALSLIQAEEAVPDGT